MIHLKGFAKLFQTCRYRKPVMHSVVYYYFACLNHMCMILHNTLGFSIMSRTIMHIINKNSNFQSLNQNWFSDLNFDETNLYQLLVKKSQCLAYLMSNNVKTLVVKKSHQTTLSHLKYQNNDNDKNRKKHWART